MNSGHFTLHIDSMAFGGTGVARRMDGKVVFISMVIPGETVVATVKNEHRSYTEAELVEILHASPNRIAAPCPHFSECGGCDWQHIAYHEQVRIKQEILKSQLCVKIPLDQSVFDNPECSPREYGYRCHAIVRCSYENGFETGFFRKQSNDIVTFEQCLVINEKTQMILHGMKVFLRDHSIPGIDTIEIHAPQDEAIVRISLKSMPDGEILGSLRKMQQALGLKGLSIVSLVDGVHEHIFGQRTCCYEVDVQGSRVMLGGSFGAFIQANMEMNRHLIAFVNESVHGAKKVLDLFSGAGNFSIPISFQGCEVLAVEQDPSSIQTASRLLEMNDCRNVRFLHEKSRRAMRWLQSQRASFDTLVLDPPREGAKDLIGLIAKLGIQRIVYISCNPSTLARDCALLAKEGFSIKGVRLFDMFPQTYHIESVAVLERL